MTSARLDRSLSGNPAAGGITHTNVDYSASAAVKVPPIDEALIEHLKRVFKFTPDKAHDLRALDRAVGHHEVIDHLTALYNVQQAEAQFPTNVQLQT